MLQVGLALWRIKGQCKKKTGCFEVSYRSGDVSPDSRPSDDKCNARPFRENHTLTARKWGSDHLMS